MSLDNKAIEEIAVNKVKISIVKSEYLDQYISENDKEPTWDGFVYIYNDKPKKKSNFVGRVPVQVKGKKCDDLSKDTISYSLSTIDLRNFLKDGGCILFAVYIGNNGNNNKIYYQQLTPVKLKKLLEEAKGQTSKTIYLNEFPSDNNEKATIFINFFQNCQKQSSFIDGKLLNLEDLKEQGVLKSLVIPFAGVGFNDFQKALIKNEVYLYAEIKGGSVPQPLDIIPQNIQVKQEIDALVTIDGQTFYPKYQVIKNAKETTLCFGDSFKIIFDEEVKSTKYNYKSSSRFRAFAKDHEFFLAYFEKGYFMIKDVKIPFNYKLVNCSNFNLEKEQEHLTFAKKAVNVLDLLRCTDDIDINDLEDKDWANLNYLITAFADNRIIEVAEENLPPVACITVGKLRFLVCLKQFKEKGKYEMFDFFKSELEVVFEDVNKSGNMLPISQFCILHANDFLTISNMDFDVLLPSFKNVKHHHETFNTANLFLLDLLNAYDQAQGIRQESLLKVCKEFSEWITNAFDNEHDNQIKILNLLQTKKRYRDLSFDEVKTLYSMVENSDTSEECIVGAYLLLDQHLAAEIHFANLSNEEQEKFKRYPIYHFWKKQKDLDF